MIKLNPEVHDWLCRAIGANVSRFEMTQLKGSTSSSVFLISHSDDFGAQRFVLRVLDNKTWLAEEPDLAAHETAALEETRKAGIRAPEVLQFSNAGNGFEAPVVLMSFVEGSVVLKPRDFQPWLSTLAVHLAEIHRHRAPDFPWQYRSWLSTENLRVPDWATAPHVWERAIEYALQPAPEYSPVFLHRDYHPVNLLWRGDEVSGVVDWINACRGPAGVDVAHCRTNLALMLGPRVAAQFLDAYSGAAGEFPYHPYWDVNSILDMGLPSPQFYKPWHEFGLDVIPTGVLRQRIEEHLKLVMEMVAKLP